MKAPQIVAEEETKVIANYFFLQPRSQAGDERPWQRGCLCYILPKTTNVYLRVIYCPWVDKVRQVSFSKKILD